MIWVTWRQHRKQLYATLAGFLLLAAMLVPTGLAMHRTFDRLGLSNCAGPGCDAKFDEFSSAYGSLVFVGVLLLVLPLLVGLFWGAPLVAREIEQGTHRMIWTQGVSRRHWALVKFALIGAGTVLLSVAYGLGTAWWYEPLGTLDPDQARFGVVFFDMQGVVPAGYTLFAVALGIAAGTLIPRTVAAMGATVAGFVVVRATVALVARPHFMTPESGTFPVAGGDLSATAGGWVLEKSVHQPDGTFVQSGLSICPTGATCPADPEHMLSPGAYNLEIFQPADRYWTFQWLETAIFVLLTALLLAWTIRRIRKLA